jgi:hypothetical protein
MTTLTQQEKCTSYHPMQRTRAAMCRAALVTLHILRHDHRSFDELWLAAAYLELLRKHPFMKYPAECFCVGLRAQNLLYCWNAATYSDSHPAGQRVVRARGL